MNEARAEGKSPACRRLVRFAGLVPPQYLVALSPPWPPAPGDRFANSCTRLPLPDEGMS